MKETIDRLIKAGLAAVDPFNAIRSHVGVDGNNLIIGDRLINLSDRELRCIAVGKGSVPMAKAIDTLLGARIDRGVVITKYEHLGDVKFPNYWETIESAHPVPDATSVRAGDRVWEILDNCSDRTLVLACISGGASSLVVAPRSWQTLCELLTVTSAVEISDSARQLLQDALANIEIDPHTYDPSERIDLPALQAIGSALLASGLSIDKINVMRSQIDRLKSGGLVDRVGKGQVIGLILSDVIGDPISAIGSGLTFHPAANNILVGNNRQACEAIAKIATEMGYLPQIITTKLDGEASIRGREIAREIIDRPAGTMLIYGGETTVNLPHNCLGKGGRNTELALAAAIELGATQTPTWVVTLATDGTDGPTDAAGATATEKTLDRALALGLDPQSALDRHDSYSFFQQLGDLHLIGATGTNVADITIAIN